MDVLFSDQPGAAWSFVVFTVVLGGLGGWATGRAFASTWRSPWLLVPALMVLAAAIRFLHYAIAGEDLQSLQFYVVSLAVVALAGAYGFRSERVSQMVRQYPWIFRASGPLRWSTRDGR